MKMETKVICPKCGAEIEIAEHQHTVKNAIVIGEDSNLGTIVLPAKGERISFKNKAEERINAMKAAGMNVDDFFTISGKNGSDILMRWQNGIPVAVTEDEVVAKIKEAGTVPERRLFRRWVESQMFSALTFSSYYDKKVLGFHKWLSWKPYEYQWKTLIEEFRVQAKLFVNDSENYAKRNRWMNKEVFIHAAEDYINKLREQYNSRTRRKCKGRPYVSLGGNLWFCDEVDEKIFRPLISMLNIADNTNNPLDLYKYAKLFDELRIHLGWSIKKCHEWIDAYKGAGAYYTCENMILFGGCTVHNEDGSTFDKYASIRILNEKAEEYCKGGNGYRMFAFMKKLIADNGIDIKAEQEKWREAKKLRKSLK